MSQVAAVPQRVRRDPSDTRTLTGGGKSLLNVLDALAIDVQHIAQIGPALPGSAKVRQKTRRDLDDATNRFFAPASVEAQENEQWHVESCLRRAGRAD
jgi:hypothetical protein